MGSLISLYNYFLILFISFLLPILCFSNHINGVISNKNGEPLPFASVYIKNTTYGVSSNAFGEYFIELKPGTYTIVYSYIGYQSKEKIINLNEVPQKKNIILDENDQNLIEYEVVSNTKNKALEIIEKVKKNKKKYIQKSFTSKEYSKNTIEKRQFKLQRKDTIEIWQLDTSKTINFKNDVLKFVESYGDFYSLESNRKNWSYEAYQDFADTKQEQDFVIIQSFEDFGEWAPSGGGKATPTRRERTKWSGPCWPMRRGQRSTAARTTRSAVPKQPTRTRPRQRRRPRSNTAKAPRPENARARTPRRRGGGTRARANKLATSAAKSETRPRPSPLPPPPPPPDPTRATGTRKTCKPKRCGKWTTPSSPVS